MPFETSSSFLDQLGRNKMLTATFCAWLAAQVLKVLVGFFSTSGGKSLRFNFKWILRSGGMPSSHVALSACLTTSAGLYHGFSSAIFAVAFCFTVITMFDAQGVRRHSGRQARILNKILEDIYEHKGVQEAQLKELVGHTPIEVYAGGLLGIVIAVMFYMKG